MGANRSSFRNVVFFHCYLGKIRTMDKVRKPNISVSYLHCYIVCYCKLMVTTSTKEGYKNNFLVTKKRKMKSVRRNPRRGRLGRLCCPADWFQFWGTCGDIQFQKAYAAFPFFAIFRLCFIYALGPLANRAGLCSGNAPESHSGGAWFESRLRHRVF
jgi:hypothetical protein